VCFFFVLFDVDNSLLRYFREAGCTGGKSQVRLTAPLSLPKLRKKIEKKKK
jgi:hypothetical protein